MDALLELLPEIERLVSREALRFSAGYRTWRWSCKDLDAGIRNFATRLERSGIGPRDRLAPWSENRPQWAAVFWACLARDVEAVPFDFSPPRNDASRIVDQTRARLLIQAAGRLLLRSQIQTASRRVARQTA
ncbi:MAG: AMP-binding protein [Bryobacterales bacterium]|nr:AMP-binding protein [Bryobacterales bacterium]